MIESHDAAQCHLKGAAIDVSIVDPTCWSSCKESAKAAGSASAQRVEDKLKHYLDSGLLDSASYIICPFVVEQFGFMSPHADDILRAAAEHQAARSGGGMPKSHCLQRLRQVVSIAVQSAISDSVVRLWCKMGTRAGCPAPDPLAFSRLRLLLRAAPSPAEGALGGAPLPVVGGMVTDAGAHSAGGVIGSNLTVQAPH